MKQTQKFYITTSIAYANAAPHIGFALELLQADVLARRQRLLGKDVYFLTGTDENGSKNQKSAEKLGISPQEFVDQNSVQVQKLIRILQVSNNDFIRTTDKARHWPAVIQMWQRLNASGDIYKKKYRGLYCQGCEAFVTPKELVNGLCPLHKTKPKILQEENYFFRLSKYETQLKNIITGNQIKIVPEVARQELLSFIKSGVKDISFSRPANVLSWGIPVPNDKKQTIYVWADALTNYISALGFATQSSKFQKYWPADIHLIGKDIIRFHALIWPAMLLSAKLPLPKMILVHGFVSSAGQKMSKSLNNIISPFDILEKYPVDALRYYLLSEIPTNKDGDFSWEKFSLKYKSDLVSGIGNLTARILGIAQKYCQFTVPNPNKEPATHPLLTKKTIYNWQQAEEDYRQHFNNYHLHRALASLWQFMAEVDKYIDTTKPWHLTHKEQEKKLNWVVYGLLNALFLLIPYLYPFLPQTSTKIAHGLGVNLEKLLKGFPQKKQHLPPKINLNHLSPLFPQVSS